MNTQPVNFDTADLARSVIGHTVFTTTGELDQIVDVIAGESGLPIFMLASRQHVYGDELIDLDAAA